MKYAQRIAHELDDIRRLHQLRNLTDKKGKDFSSNDYLGLSQHPLIRIAMIQALESGIPLGSTGSRLLRGNDPLHTETEKRLALFKNAEATLIFNTGYEANVGVISTLCKEGDLIFSDEKNHASLIDGIRASKAERIIFPHNDVAFLKENIRNAPRTQQKFLISESLFSMDGDTAPLKAYLELAREYDLILIIDEAHATGVFGPHGTGLLEVFDTNGVNVISIHTCGKAFGSFGAFVACQSSVREFLVNRCRNFVYTTAPPPLLMVQWNAIIDIIESEGWRRRRLRDLSAYFRNELAGSFAIGPTTSQIVPIIVGSPETAIRMASYLQERGFDIRAIRYPTVPNDQARLRISIHADHRDSDLDKLIEILKNA